MALAATTLLWQSVFWLPFVSVSSKLMCAGAMLFSAVRPREALLPLAAFVALGAPLSWLGVLPRGHVSEALVLSFLVGWLVHRVCRPDAADPGAGSLGAPLAVFATVVACSLIVTSAGVEVGFGAPAAFVRASLTALVTGYVDSNAYEIRHWYLAVLLLEGCLLVVAILQLTRGRRELQSGIGRMLAAGAAGAALLSCSEFARFVVRSLAVSSVVSRARLGMLQIGVHIPDVNAAGSYFVLVLPILLALAVRAPMPRSGRIGRPVLISAWMLGVAAVWLTGSRSSIVALIGVTVVSAVARWRRSLWKTAVIVALAVLCATVMATTVRTYWSMAHTLQNRWLFAEVSGDLWKGSPVFGIGISQYYERSVEYLPKVLGFPRGENAHNNFLQIGVELGLVGIGAFLWTMASAFRRLFAARAIDRRDWLLNGLMLGIGATLLTFLVGHPLLSGAYAYTFWIALALSVARADTIADGAALADGHAPVREASRLSWLTRRRVAIVLAIIVIVSTPQRASRAEGLADLSGVRFGFGEAGHDEATTSDFAWVDTGATFFADARARSVMLIVSQPSPETAVELGILVDGKLVNKVALRDDVWHEMRMLLPVTGGPRRFRRIEFAIAPFAEQGQAPRVAFDPVDRKIRVRWIDIK